MKKHIALFLILAETLLLNGCAGTAALDPPTVYLANLTLTDATLFEQRYRLQFRVQNPNPVDLPIDGIAYELELNGQPFAQGVGDRSISVPRYGSALLDVEGSSNLLNMVRQATVPKPGEAGHVQYRLKGKLGIANGRQVPFDYRGAF